MYGTDFGKNGALLCRNFFSYSNLHDSTLKFSNKKLSFANRTIFLEADISYLWFLFNFFLLYFFSSKRSGGFITWDVPRHLVDHFESSSMTWEKGRGGGSLTQSIHHIPSFWNHKREEQGGKFTNKNMYI